ncbi:uncharacterized protein LODBEIA_P39610 [Lodderomyces beijingensis]|uniref:J domain-containing protein n=1 Tax=Lodderomyces beijingensis TaxID=1775926 RepID=A0ABP0ZTY7_9ASCO
MGVPFPDINPYEVLGVDSDASPILIKKTYKRLCLKHHPDKKHQQSKSNDEAKQAQEVGEQGEQGGQEQEQELFTKIQFAYSILNDPIKRNRYDTLGSLFDADFYGDGDEAFDWKEYFQSMNEKITIEMIEEDKLKYQGSDEEEQDIISNFVYYDGDFLKLFESIPHLEFTPFEEQRVYKIVEAKVATIPGLDKSILRSWEKYTKSRKTKVRNMLNKLAKEAKEAKELEKLIKDKRSKGSDLKSLIKSRQNHRMDDLIANLESKYAKKRGKKRSSEEIDEDEFERIQSKLMKKKK